MLDLLKLLTFPISGPFIGTKWIAGVLLEEAERQLYDEAGIRQRMADVERQFQLGEIDAGTFERRQEDLLQRLLDARDYHRRKQAEAAGALPDPSAVAAETGGGRRGRRHGSGRRHAPQQRRRSHG